MKPELEKREMLIFNKVNLRDESECEFFHRT